jgi:phage terminase large subunit GpA-like protein
MVQMMDQPRTGLLSFVPLPPFPAPEELLSDSLPLLDPPSRLSVTECAERHLRVETNGVWQQYDRSVTPYLVEPADTSRSRLYSTCAFVGPSQSGKSFMMVTVSTSHIINDPGPVLLIHMTRPDANAWVEESLNPTIQNSPSLLERLGRGPDDNTFSRKRFKGMRLTVGIPTPTALSGRKQLRVLMSDYDHFKQVLGRKDNPEGTPWGMAQQRVKTFLSRGMVFVESTPAFEVTDMTWQASERAPHEMPPVAAGVVPIYNQGTRGRWYWECRDCAEVYEPTFARLQYDVDLDPTAAGEGAEMACPHCGSLIAHRHKFEMNRAALTGRGGWLHETSDGALVPMGDSSIRGTDIASWALNGAAATFSNWGKMVAKYMNAIEKFEDHADDLDLRQFYFLDCGLPFRAKPMDEDADLTLSALKSGRSLTPRGTAPEWVRFILVTVDVQGGYFPVMVTGMGLDGRRTIIDRLDLAVPPCGSQRTLDPGKYAGDWDVLVGLADQVWPVEGQEYGLKPAALSVDFQGARGVSDNAEKFWRARREADQGALWFLARGQGGFKQRDRVWHMAPERASGGKKSRGIKLLNIATDLVKDTIAAALTRPVAEASSFPLPEWLDDDGVGELIAEQRGPAGWTPKPGQKRNENLDLSVQAQALAEHKGLRRLKPDAPFFWAVMGAENPFWVPSDKTGTPIAETKTKTARPTRIGYLNRGQ